MKKEMFISADVADLCVFCVKLNLFSRFPYQWLMRNVRRKTCLSRRKPSLFLSRVLLPVYKMLEGSFQSVAQQRQFKSHWSRMFTRTVNVCDLLRPVGVAVVLLTLVSVSLVSYWDQISTGHQWVWCLCNNLFTLYLTHFCRVLAC